MTTTIVVDISASNPNLGPDFEGVNPDALAAADGVFEITYTADEYARVWIDHPGENVTFTADGKSFEGGTTTSRSRRTSRSRSGSRSTRAAKSPGHSWAPTSSRSAGRSRSPSRFHLHRISRPETAVRQ